MGFRRHELRLATAAQHERLDSLTGLFSDRISYGRYLRSATAFRAFVEADLTPDLIFDIRLAPLQLHRHLVDDCQDLGVAPSGGSLSTGLGRSRDEQLGALYVLEGSLLGAGLLMTRAVHLGLTESFGARHLARQCRERSRWPIFLAHLEAVDDFDVEAACAGARKVFDVALTFAEASYGTK